MNSKKYKRQIHEKYSPKMQFVINVLKSCETEDQIEACTEWAKNLITQWLRCERMKLIVPLGMAALVVKRIGILEEEIEHLQERFYFVKLTLKTKK